MSDLTRLQTWRKLKGRSTAELLLRARQLLSAMLERAGISRQARLPDDHRFARLLNTGWAGAAGPSPAALLERFRARATPRFFAAFDHPADLVATLRERWPQAEAGVIQRAERILAGRFDLLGRTSLPCGAPPDWHRDATSGARVAQVHWRRVARPEPDGIADYKLIWELNRHQYFVTLGKAYWYTRDERYAAAFVDHLSSWIEGNPPKRGVNWASSLELAFRAIAWIWGLYFFKGSPHLTASLFWQALKLLYRHGRHVETYLSTYSGPNTHLTGEALGLVYLGTLFPELVDAARWRQLGRSILVEQLDRQVRPDGSYFEQSTYYHRYTTDFCLHLSILSRLNGIPVEPGVDARLEALLTHLMYVTQADGRTPLMGDDDGGRLLFLDDRAPSDFRAALATGAVLFGRPEYRHVAGEAAEETAWLLGCAGLRAFDALESRAPRVTSRAFQDGGYYVMRDGWGPDASSLVVDCGPHGALNYAHAHADALSFTLVVRGTPVVVDPGTYTYRLPAALRDYFRSSAAHNTVTVADQSSSIPSGPFTWRHVGRSTAMSWRHGARCDYFEGRQDGYARLTPPAIHTRSVLFLHNDYWIVRDRVRTDGDHAVAAYLHFAPEIGLEIVACDRALARWTKAGGGGALDIGIFGQPGALRADEGLVSDSYGTLSRGCTCVFTARGHGSRDIVSMLVPRYDLGHAVEMAERPAEHGRAFVIARGDDEDTLLIGAGGDAAGAVVASDATWAWVRASRRDGAPSEFLLLNGRNLSWHGSPLVSARSEVPYVAARRLGRELHVEVHGDVPCHVALLGADRLVVRGGRAFAIDPARPAPAGSGAGAHPGDATARVETL